jgi:hypothetical protein
MDLERDPLLDALRALPPLSPSASLDAEVKYAAQAVLAGAPLSLGERIVYQGIVPTLLGGVTVSYLMWAVQTASGLY